jgi:hypothetical protein
MEIAREVLLEEFVPLLDDEAFLALYRFNG